MTTHRIHTDTVPPGDHEVCGEAREINLAGAATDDFMSGGPAYLQLRCQLPPRHWEQADDPGEGWHMVPGPGASFRWR